ncbi:MAG: ATPase, T2SS/T4P/T4SS family [Planctomycetota bacterium]|jgi:general secretion pathway protein E
MASKKKTKTPAPKKGKSSKKGKSPKESPPAETGDLLDMDQAIALLKTTRPTFYRWLRSGKIKGMKVGRQWRFYREDIERFLKGEGPRIDVPADIHPLIETLKKRLRDLGEKDTTPPETNEVVHAVNLMIRVGIVMGASDIHLAPHYVEELQGSRAALRYRLDGVLNPLTEIDTRLLPALMDRWKVMASCDRHETTRSQDGRLLIQVPGKKPRIDIRVSFLPSSLGETLTARILDPGKGWGYLSIEGAGFAARDRDRLLKWVKAPWGVIVVTGPTGSGKTTTLYGALKQIASPNLKIITVEDPVEVSLPWMVQVHLKPSQGVTFASSMRAALRSDPDVLLVGELRDSETMRLAQQVALTGHLVMTALHVEDGAKALARMVEVSGGAYIVGEAVKLVVAQRLVRTLCPDCSREAMPPPHLLDEARRLATLGGLDWDQLPKAYREPGGCSSCAHTGFRGRTVVAEALEVTPEIGIGIRRGATTEQIRNVAVSQGMTTIAADGVRRAAEGTTTLLEVFRVLGLQ